MSEKGAGRRSELDGIRALAIAGVLGVHANNLVPGGHLGVAIFFVLSGYLITTLLVDELRSTGRAGLRRFYVLRTARLLPSLVIVLAASGVALVALGRPSHNIALGIGASILFFANIFLAYTNGQVMHLFTWVWTLSLEEQFYLLWPILLAVAVRRDRVRLLAVAALFLSVTAEVLRCILPFNTAEQSARVYFGPDTRMDGLLIGCLLALALDHLPIHTKPRWASALAVGSAAVITFSYFAGTFGRRYTYSVWIGAAELSAAVLILAVTANRTSWPARLLSTPSIAHVGRISYGLYLWNIPVYLAVQHLLHGAVPEFFNGLIWLAATLILAEASFHLVEQPILRRVRSSLL